MLFFQRAKRPQLRARAGASVRGGDARQPRQVPAPARRAQPGGRGARGAGRPLPGLRHPARLQR